MRRLFFLSLLFISINAFSQIDADSLHQAIQRRNDSVLAGFNNSVESFKKEQELQNIQSLLRVVDEQKKRNAKQKRDAMIRIGIGVLFFAVLIIGIMRRRKKQA